MLIDLAAVRAAGLKLDGDSLGGAARPYWEPINAIDHMGDMMR